MTKETRWRIDFKVYRNDRLMHSGTSGDWGTYHGAAHIADSEIHNADNYIEGAKAVQS